MSLAAQATPVRRLRPPLVRAVFWLALALLALVLVGMSLGLRPDLSQKARETVFVVGAAAALLTGFLAALAAFMASLPDRSRLWLVLPAPAFAVWASTIGYGCVTAWVDLGDDGVRFADLAGCLATIALTSVPLSAAMLLMLRHAAPLRPAAATMMGGLAVAAMTAAGLLLVHALDATIMILAWNFGTAIVITALGGLFGRRMLSWVAMRAVPQLR